MKAYQIDILPVPTPRPRVRVMDRFGKKVPSTYYPAKYTKYKKDLAILIVSSGVKPGAYHKLNVVFFLPYPKGTAKKRLIEGFPHTKKPDVDNYVKGLMDGLEASEVVKNDSRFYSVRMMKLYTVKKPRIEFQLL